MLIFDIETGPLADDELMATLPPLDESGYAPSEFDESSVNVNGLKDPAKIAAKIDDARRSHEARQAQLPALLEDARKSHFANYKGNAAKSPVTGQVLAVGLLNPATSAKAIIEGDECDILSSVWAKIEKCAKANRKLIGHNILGFDLPFLVKRSWVCEVDVPMSLIRNGRYFSDRLFVDTMDTWGCGSREYAKIGFLGEFFGVGAKPDGIDGGDFARLWFGSPEERETAKAYLFNDLHLTAAVARRMQLL